MAAAGVSWLKSEKDAQRYVEKATSRGILFREILTERTVKDGKKMAAADAAKRVNSLLDETLDAEIATGSPDGTPPIAGLSTSAGSGIVGISTAGPSTSAGSVISGPSAV